MDSPERQESTPNSTNEELVQRFSSFFNGIEPTSSSSDYVRPDSNPFGPRFHRRPIKRHLKEEITKQVVTRRVDDKKYLTGPYRAADWGELVVEHITKEKITDLKTGEIILDKPERYVLKFIDYANYAPGNGVTTRAYTNSDLAYSYDFSPTDESDDVTITPNNGPVIHPGDRNYPYFIHAIETAEEILASNS
jgi:hypothetical protein